MTNNARRMMELFAQLRHQRKGPAQAELQQMNLSFSHLRVLQLLADTNFAMKDVAEQLEMTPPSITAISRRLSQSGLIARQPHPEDSRSVVLALTEAGRDLHARLTAEHEATFAALLAGLSPEEQQTFLDLLERAVLALSGPGTSFPVKD